MFGSAVLDTAIGLIFVFFTISTVCSNIFTLISRALNSKGRLLKEGLETLLGSELYRHVMQHPLIKDSAITNKSILGFKVAPERLPAWIDPKAFSDIITDICEEASKVSDIARVLPSEADNAMRYFILQLHQGKASLEQIHQEIERWYNNRMDTLTLIFKRQSQYVIGVVAILLSVIFNVNTLIIGQALWQGPTLRDAVVEAASAQIAANANQGFIRPTRPEDDTFEEIRGATERINDLSFLNVPIGWTPQELKSLGLPTDLAMSEDPNREVPSLFTMILGWLITAGAAMFGGPFWFDLLKKLTGVRSGS